MADRTAAASSSIDRYGIQRSYLDNADQPSRLDEDTVAALRAAVGPADPELAELAPVVIRPGDGWQPEVPAEVLLEDGERRVASPGQPPRLPYGYHWLITGDVRRPLIVSPGSCLRPARRSWGWTAQLYATRSAASWGIGDFADLRRLTTLAARQGAGFVLVNPLHAGGSTAAELPQQPSPYFPASRRFFNPLYLAVPDLPGAAQVLGSRLTELAAEAQAAGDPRIDRDAIWRVKRAALREIFDATDAGSAPELAGWRRRRGQSVADFAAWCVLAERYRCGWPDWPAEARSPSGALARRLPDEQPDDLAFVCWLQWQAERQLSAAGGSTAVLQDLPIGVDPQGADAWVYQDLLADGVTVGAPPDPFNRSGQDWGLPPFVPWRLRDAGYQPFIEAIRATIAHAGGLRIDHVMGLFRLWWVPAGRTADRGGYVRYPASDLLDIVALESHRANAPVVGEDLGTVEPGVREELAERNVLSYRLLWFEQQPPANWPVGALAAVSTHDLPTVAGLWSGSDLADQRESGLDADEQATEPAADAADRPGRACRPTPTRPRRSAGPTGCWHRHRRCCWRPAWTTRWRVPDRPNMPGTTEPAELEHPAAGAAGRSRRATGGAGSGRAAHRRGAGAGGHTTRLTGCSPRASATTESAANADIRRLVESVALPRCGVSTTRCRQCQQLLAHPRLELEDVQPGAGDPAGGQRPGQRRLVHQWAAAGVDQDRGGLHQSQRTFVDQVMGLRGQRGVQRDEIGSGQQLVQLHPARPHARHRTFLAGGVEDRHVEAVLCPPGDGRADPSHADDAERLAGHIQAHRFLQQRPGREVAVPQQPVGLHQPAGTAEQQRHRLVGGGVGEHAGRVGHLHPRLPGGGDVDVVVAHRHVGDQPQLGIAGQHRTVDGVGEQRDQRLAALAGRQQFRAAQRMRAVQAAHLGAGRPHRRHRLIVNRLGDQHCRRGGHFESRMAGCSHHCRTACSVTAASAFAASRWARSAPTRSVSE